MLLLLACTTGDTGKPTDTDDTGEPFVAPPAGSVRVCLSWDLADPSVLDTHPRFDATFDGEAPFTETLPIGECWTSGVTRALSFTDGDGGHWQVAWALYDPDQVEVTPSVDLAPGDPVTLSLTAQCGEGCAFSFAVAQDGFTVLAATEGYWAEALTSDDTPGLSVYRGAELGQADDGCGLMAYDEVVFEGLDDTLVLEPWATGTVLAGAELSAWAVSANRYVEYDCTDVSDTFSWAVAR